MNPNFVQKMRLGLAIVSGGFMIALGGMAVSYTQGADVTASGSSSGPGSVTTTTPPTTPPIAKAEPSITGPPPLFAGEAPNSNPQAGIP